MQWEQYAIQRGLLSHRSLFDIETANTSVAVGELYGEKSLEPAGNTA